MQAQKSLKCAVPAVYVGRPRVWPNRDPLGDEGSEAIRPAIGGSLANGAGVRQRQLNDADAEFLEGPNLYLFVQNSPIDGFDPLGLFLGIQIARCYVLDSRPNYSQIWSNCNGQIEMLNGTKTCVMGCFTKNGPYLNYNIQYITRPLGWPCPGGWGILF